MNGLDIIQAAIARRNEAGLSVHVTGIDGRDEPHIRHCKDIAERDAYIERCKARGETVSIVGQ